jgi:aspartate/methionine/tyrosine aminotransferase
MQVSKRLFSLETESSFAILEKVKKLELEGKDIINLGIGQPDFPTPQNILEAAKKAITDGHHGYTPSNGILPLREAVSKKIYEDYNTSVSPDNILITPGGKPVIFFAALIFGEPGVEIIYPDPGFPIYRSMIKYTGAKPVPLELKEKDNFEVNIELLEKLITNKTRLIILNNPNNPTGSFMNETKISQIVNILEKYP